MILFSFNYIYTLFLLFYVLKLKGRNNELVGCLQPCSSYLKRNLNPLCVYKLILFTLLSLLASLLQLLHSSSLART